MIKISWNINEVHACVHLGYEYEYDRGQTKNVHHLISAKLIDNYKVVINTE